MPSEMATELLRKLRNNVGRNHCWIDSEMLPIIDAVIALLLAENKRLKRRTEAAMEVVQIEKGIQREGSRKIEALHIDNAALRQRVAELKMALESRQMVNDAYREAKEQCDRMDATASKRIDAALQEPSRDA